MVGDLCRYGTVWYHPNGIANILSLSRVKKNGCEVTYNSSDKNEFHVLKLDGKTRVFKESEHGLFYMDTSTKQEVTLVNTVADNKAKYTSRDYSCALMARNIQKIIGRPSTQAFIKIVNNNQLPNCPITSRNIMVTEKIFGPDVGSLKGKTVRHTSDRVDLQIFDILASIMSDYQNVTLGGDIMFVNKIPFFMTISRNIKFGTAEVIQNQQSATI